jgi:hypothetical protein
MKKKYFFFVFKHNFRKNAFNNFLEIKKIKNFLIFNLSGPLKYYLIGKTVIFFVQKFNFFFKNCILISCDAKPLLLKNSVNIWFGGTSYKVPQDYKILKNNCHVFENFIKKEKNLLKFYPYDIDQFYLQKQPKVIFIGDFNFYNYNIIRKIWHLEKKKIFKNFQIIEKKFFWAKYNLENHKKIQAYYIAIKDLLRFNLIIKLSDLLKDDLIVVGNRWKPHIKSALKSNYKKSYAESLYKGNICLDLGSKWGNNCLYPRSINIIESGGLLLQSKQSDVKNIFHKNYRDMSFNNLNELIKKIKKLLNNKNEIKSFYNNQYKTFNNENLNYQTLKKIFSTSKIKN